MSKILTISIAAYNVASYIQTTLDSLVSSKYIDDLEIFVVDDGGQDDTLTIAKEYQKRYPDSIFPVHKENGGYGTTVNYSMEHATGKYFKLLDGDDWFDTDALNGLVQGLKSSDADVIITPFYSSYENGKLEKVSYIDDFGPHVQLIKNLQIDRAIGMWAITYKTEILKESNLKLPSKTFFTDIYYSLYPFAKAKTIQCIDFPVYCYRLGHDGQSVSIESRLKNIEQLLTINRNTAKFISHNSDNDNYSYLLMRATYTYKYILKNLLLLPYEKVNKDKFALYDQEIKEICLPVYQNIERLGKLGKFIWLCRKTKYQAYYLLKILYPKGIPNF